MKWASKPAGFTIIELLIVVVVIAVLTAILVVVYGGVTNRAYDSSVQNDIRNISNQVELYQLNNARYPTASELSNQKVKVNKSAYLLSRNSMLYCGAPDGSTYAIIGKSRSGTNYYATPTTNGVKVTSFSFPTGIAVDCPNAGAPTTSATWLHTNNGTSLWAAWVIGS